MSGRCHAASAAKAGCEGPAALRANEGLSRHAPRGPRRPLRAGAGMVGAPAGRRPRAAGRARRRRSRRRTGGIGVRAGAPPSTGPGPDQAGVPPAARGWPGPRTGARPGPRRPPVPARPTPPARRTGPWPRRSCGRSGPRPTTGPRRPHRGRTSTGRRSRWRSAAICSAQPSWTPPGRVITPHSSTHSAIATPQTVQTVPVDRSGSFIATRPAKPMTKNSPIRVEAQSVRTTVSPSPGAAGPRRP